jgi:hypothetical protein
MAFVGQDPILGKRRFFHAVAISAQVQNLATAFFSWLNQQGGRPDLQVVELIAGTATAQVVVAGAVTLRALILKKTTVTAAYGKLSDHATDFSAAATTVLLKQAAIDTLALFYPKGLAHATGITFESHTTPDGTTTSAAGDGASGVALLSA